MTKAQIFRDSQLKNLIKLGRILSGGSRDTDSDLSVEDYTSSEEEEGDSEESSTNEDRPIVRPLPQDWTDQLTPSVIEDFVDNAGQTTILSRDKKEIDFSNCYSQKIYFL